MEIKEVKANAYHLRLVCDCGIEMKMTSKGVDTPEIFYYVCPRCNKTAKSKKAFPMFEWRPEDEESMRNSMKGTVNEFDKDPDGGTGKG